MAYYGIWAERSSASRVGPAQAWLKDDDSLPFVCSDRKEAEERIEELLSQVSPLAAVSYRILEMEAELAKSILQERDQDIIVRGEEPCRFFREAARIAESKGYRVGELGERWMPIYRGGEEFCRVDRDCTIQSPKDLNREDTTRLWNDLVDPLREAHEYVGKMENSPILTAEGLSKNKYRLLAEFNSIVLAGRDDGEYGFTFVTWERNHDGTGVGVGNYYTESTYTPAKQDFALRAGLVQPCQVLNNEQRRAVYDLVEDCGDRAVPITRRQEELLQQCLDKMAEADPSLTETVTVLVAQRDGPAKVTEIRNSLYTLRNLIGEDFGWHVDFTAQGAKPQLVSANLLDPENPLEPYELEELQPVSRCLPEGTVPGPAVIAAYDATRATLRSLRPEEIKEYQAKLDDPAHLPAADILIIDTAGDKPLNTSPTLNDIHMQLGRDRKMESRQIGPVAAFYTTGHEAARYEDIADRVVAARIPGSSETVVGLDQIIFARADPETGNIYSFTDHDYMRYDLIGRKTPSLTPEELYRRLWKSEVIARTPENTPQVTVLKVEPGQPPKQQSIPVDMPLGEFFGGKEFDTVDAGMDGVQVSFRTGVTAEEQNGIFAGQANYRSLPDGLVVCLGTMVVSAWDGDRIPRSFTEVEMDTLLEHMNQEVFLTPQAIHQHLEEFNVFADSPSRDGPEISM